MKSLLILAILSLTTYAKADQLICESDSSAKTQPVKVVVDENTMKMKMIYTRTDNTILNLVLEVRESAGNEYSGTMYYSEYGDMYDQGPFKLSLPENYGTGSLTYKFNSQKNDTNVVLRCSHPDSR